MRACDVMTTEVISVAPTMSVRAVARLLSECGISAVPVIDGERLVGIVSEGDLLRRIETGTEHMAKRRRSWWLDWLASPDLRRYVKSRARTVGDVMTKDVVWVTDTAELADIAELLEMHGIKRVPVLRDGKLAGIVSRANLVRALAAAHAPEGAGEAGDRAIRDRLLAELRALGLSDIIAASDVIVRDRIVRLWVCDDRSSPEQRQAVRVAAESIPGVKRVKEHLVPASVVPGWHR